MKLRRITAALLAAAMLAGTSVPAYAAEITAETASVAYNASSTEWNGKAAMKEGGSYTVSKNITVSSAVTIPKKATLTVKKGAKLTVAEKGSITVNGTLNVQTKATLAVNGKLTVNSGKSFKCDGSVTFGNKAVGKFDGRFYLYSSGKISGTPSKVSFGKSSAVVIAGTNNCKKLATALNNNYAALLKSSSKGKVSAKTAKKELQEHYNKHLSLLFNDKAYVHSINAIYSPADIEYIMDAAKGLKINAEQFLFDNTEGMTDTVLSDFSLGNLKSSSDVKSVKVTCSEAVDCTSIDGAKEALAPRFGNISQYWITPVTYTFTMKNGKTHKTTGAYIGFVYSGGKIYTITETFDEASFK